MDAHFNLNHCIELRRIGVMMINVALKGIPLKQSSSDIRGAWETGSWPFEEKLSKSKSRAYKHGIHSEGMVLNSIG